jgi:hypothetical protein
MMEIVVNKAAELGVPATLDAPIQATFAEAEDGSGSGRKTGQHMKRRRLGQLDWGYQDR